MKNTKNDGVFGKISHYRSIVIFSALSAAQMCLISIAEADDMRSAEAAERSGNLQDAVSAYRKVTKSDTPQASDAMLAQARLLKRNGKIYTAIAQMENYLSYVRPLDIEVRILLIEALREEGAIDMARNHVNVARKFRPLDRTLALEDAKLLIQEKNFAKALAELEAREGAAEFNIDVLLTRCFAFIGVKNPSSCVPIARTVLAVEPLNPKARVALAESLLAIGSNEGRKEIIEMFSKNPGLYHEDKDIALRASRVLDAVNEVRLAKEVMDRAGQAHPFDRDIAERFVELCRKTNDIDSALSRVLSLYSVQPQNDQVVHTLAELYMEKKQFDDAAEVLSKLVKLYPERTWAAVSYSRLLKAAGGKDLARKVLERNISLSEDKADAVGALCVLMDEEGETKAAMEKALAFKRQNPKDERYSLILAELFARRGAQHDAIRELASVKANDEVTMKTKDKIREIYRSRASGTAVETQNLEERVLR